MPTTFRRLVLAVALALPLTAGAGSYDRYHPDQHFRAEAIEAASEGRHDAAVAAFLRAARYADKGSQLALALAYWNGEGVPVDRPRAYAWADLASERGYPAFLAVRETYWGELDEAQREEARRIGAELVAEYGDAVAKKRLERLLFQGSRQKTGSRTGSATVKSGVSAMDPAARASMIASMTTTPNNNMYPAGAAPPNVFPLNGFAQALGRMAAWESPGYYADVNWKPKEYWRHQDRFWRDVPEGFVTVRPLQRDEAGDADEGGSR